MTGIICGWRAEATYGTNPLTGATDYVYHFGDVKDKHKVPIPWNEIEMVPVYRLGNTAPVNLVEGAKNVEFTLQFCPLAADEWKYLLGLVTGGNTFTNVKGNTEDLTLPSRTIYFQTSWDDVVVVKGCVVKGFDFYADRVLDMITEIHVRFLGAEVVEHVKITTATSPRYHASLAITSAWKWGDSNAITLDTNNIIGDGGEINRIHVHVENILKPRFSTKIVQVKKIGIAVEIDFDIPLKATTNKILRALRDLETNDFYYKWLRGASYWELWVNNIKFRKVSAVEDVFSGDQPVYSFAGSNIYDSTNTGFEDAVKFKAVDGVTYS